MAALASAMNSRLSGSQSQEEGLDKGSDDADAPAASTEGENDETAQASAVPVHMSAEGLVPPRRPSEPQHDPFPQVKLNIKRADNSNSGDDKAIEKHALEWMNQHLASKEIQIDDLFSSLGNGLNLIYALEDATGETVGKYNKRAMLPVHKIDNIAVALNFISKKGINTGFISPQDMMDGNKSKILTLFNYITKKF
ncbi:calponin homology domain-containing protein [Chytriomyces cf. hyalinus JEL632]|nr:calponin homology domain-containing protein [Chytriomyces cf. hyalinus JEL632]